MANRYVRSLFWLVGCGSFGYLLYVACTPSEADISARKDVSIYIVKQQF